MIIQVYDDYRDVPRDGPPVPKYQTIWTYQDMAEVRKLYGILNVEVLSDRLGRTVSSIRECAHRMGVSAIDNRNNFRADLSGLRYSHQRPGERRA